MGQTSVIIIGAGIAGLSAGCYALMNGFDTLMFEMHDKPGGLCTAWNRKGYTIDGCMHHLAGASARSDLNALWLELGALSNEQVNFFDKLTRVESPDGEELIIYADIDRPEQHMKERWPQDSQVISEYTRAARQFLPIDFLSLAVAKPLNAALAVLPRIGAFRKWSNITLAQFGSRFESPFLRRAFPTLEYDLPDIPMLIHLNFLARCHNRILAWPSGGSLAFSRAIEKRYMSLGGRLSYRSKVAKMLVEDNTAVGVRLSNGTEHHADIIVSATDGDSTILDMLDGRYIDDRIKAYYADPPERIEMALQVTFGVDRDMAREPHSIVYFLEEPVTLSGRHIDRLNIEVFNFDQSLAPPGKAVIKVLLGSSYKYWSRLCADRANYVAEKSHVADIVLAQLDKRFPGLFGQVQMIDAQPLSPQRGTQPTGRQTRRGFRKAVASA